MNRRRAARDACCTGIRGLMWDLACAQEALAEIETCWRRSLPWLPATLPLRLRDEARQIEADARSLAAGGPSQPSGPALEVAGRFAALRRDVAAARAMTCGPGTAEAGDDLMWDVAEGALRRAASCLLSLIVHRTPVTGWSLDPAPSPGAPAGQAALLVTLGQGTPAGPASSGPEPASR
jgi:hypothetical protein